MSKTLFKIIAFYGILFFIAPLSVYSRNYLQVVGSSTVYPFLTLSQEIFLLKYPKFKAGVIEKTGTGAGFNLFCSGKSLNYPDVSMASRPIKKSEVDLCRQHNIEFTELNIGIDGITIIHNKSMGDINLTPKQLFLALANWVPDSKQHWIKNPYTKWNQVDDSLPNIPIRFLGRPETSGTRDAFIHLVMKVGFSHIQKENPNLSNEVDGNVVYKTIRTDSHWVNMAENDPLTVEKVHQDENTFGILGYNYYKQTKNKIDAAMINGKYPTQENINNGNYALTRPLYIYIKNLNMQLLPGAKEFLLYLYSNDLLGKRGYLINIGLISTKNSDKKKDLNKIYGLYK